MTVKELKQYLEYFDDNADVIVWNFNVLRLDSIEDVSDNNGAIQLNVEIDEDDDD